MPKRSAKTTNSISVRYTGFPSPSDDAWDVDTVPTKATSPAAFYSGFVAPRRPVILDGFPDDAGFAPEEWRLPLLAAHCAGATVAIEHRSDATRTFGTGIKEPTRFPDFVKQLAAGREDLYLTTQPLPEDRDGLTTQLYASPINEMRRFLPCTLKPALAGKLALSSINLWIGSSRSGQSSNLHHDHHDNIYILLQGRKRVTVFPPSAAPAMALHGPASLVHRNGLVNYRGSATRDDGAMPHLVVERLRAAVASAAPAARARLRRALARAEKELTEACARDAEYAAAIRASPEDESEGAAGEVDGLVADDDSGDEERPASSASAASAPASKRARVSAEVDDMWAAITASAAADVGAAAAKKKRAPAKIAKPRAAAPDPAASAAQNSIPNHFSRIDLPGLRSTAAGAAGATDAAAASQRKHRREASRSSAGDAAPESAPADDEPALAEIQSCARSCWPLFAAASGRTFTLRAGQMLYLPAGWFHEVVSLGDDDDAAAGCRGAGSTAAPPAASTHVALNYWFYPPSSAGSFDAPYTDSYWEDAYAAAVAVTPGAVAAAGKSAAAASSS